MGCDIHFFVEKRSKSYQRQVKINELVNDTEEEVEEVWESADEWEDNDPTWVSPNYSKQFYTGRNYALFGILAGVRYRPNNGPHIKPRGIPENASKEVLDHYEQWDMDAHTPSYMTLSELKEIDWKVYEEEVARPIGNDFLNTIERMSELGDDENVRCVFWFDN